MAAFFRDFDDAFFYQITALCMMLAFVDWAIGPAARAAMREKMAEWWIRLDDSSFAGLVASDAAITRSTFIEKFGSYWYSWRRIWRSFVVSTITLFAILVVFSAAGIIEKFHAGHASYTLVMLVPNAIFDWILLNITIVLLGLAAKSPSLFRLAFIASIGFASLILKAIFVFILFLAVGLTVLPIFEVTGISDAGYNFLVSVFGPRPDLGPPPCVECVFQGVFDDLFVVFFAAITGCLWAIFNILMAVAIGVSKLFRPVLKPMIAWLLYRFQESDKGVLTVVSAGLGGVAKLAQQAIKIYL